MQKLLENDEGITERPDHSVASWWLGRILGFLGSAVIFWIALRTLAPIMVTAWAISWIDNAWVRAGISLVAAVMFGTWLSRIEGTIWGKYFVIIGYLLSLLLIIWIALHLLHYL